MPTPEQINAVRAAAGYAPLQAGTSQPVQSLADKYGWNKPQPAPEKVDAATGKTASQTAEDSNNLFGTLNKAYDVFSNLPGIKQAGQVVGGAVGAAGGAIGGAVGGIGKTAMNVAQGKPVLQDVGSSIVQNAKDTAKFGYDTGKAAVPAAMMGEFGGAVPNAALGVSQFHQGIQDIHEGVKNNDPEQISRGAMALGVMGVMAKGGVESIKSGDNFGSGLPKEIAGRAKNKISVAARPVTDAAKGAGEYLKGVPERATINTAEKAKTEAIISQLPMGAKKAADNGILPRDLQLFSSASPEELRIAKQMHEDAKIYNNDRTAPNPALRVGQEMRKPVQALEDLKDTFGEQLGNYTKDIKPDQLANISEAVLTRLQKVPGLRGLKISDDLENPGLDFSRTSVASNETAPDRAAIENAFKHALKSDAEQLHLHRQELFEVLGGKKSSLTTMTDTQDKGLQAIRQGESDVLDQTNPKYKELNQKYAQVTGALKGIRDYFKSTTKNGTDVPSDILDLKASQVARRLTSNAGSNADLRGALDAAKKVLSQHGIEIGTDIPKLQEMYNALNRYYDLTPDTSLAGQVKLGNEQIPTSIKEIAGTLGKKFVNSIGKSDAVRRKVFEDFLNSVDISKEDQAAGKMAGNVAKKFRRP